MNKTTIPGVFTSVEFAKRIGATKQWVNWKIREAESQGVSKIIFYKHKNPNKPISMKIVYSGDGARRMLKGVI